MSDRDAASGQNLEALRFLVRAAVIERHRLAIDISNFAKTLDKGAQGYLFLFSGPGVPKNADARNASLLRDSTGRKHQPADCDNKRR